MQICLVTKILPREHMVAKNRKTIDVLVSLHLGPLVAEGSLLVEDYEARGVLAENAARVFMKLLWYSGLCRSALSVQVTAWSRNSDKQLNRLVSYVAATLQIGLEAVVLDKFEDCRFDLFCDADLGGCAHELNPRLDCGCRFQVLKELGVLWLGQAVGNKRSVGQQKLS